MLYLTTRDDKDAYTANRTLYLDIAPDGGSFVPFRLPVFAKEEMDEFLSQPFGQIVADILNIFYSGKFSAWDVDMAIGRKPLKLVSLSQKILLAEIWHNPSDSFGYAVKNLYMKATDNQGLKPTVWFEISAYIAFLFGIFGEMKKQGMQVSPDVAVETSNMPLLVALLYARKMGLSTGKMVISCKENSSMWDVLRRGSFANTLPDEEKILIEQILYNCFAPDAVKKYLFAKADGCVYTADSEKTEQLKDCTFAAVVSDSRLENVINSVMRTDAYQIGADTARVFGGLYDYRASTRENNLTLVLVADSPK